MWVVEGGNAPLAPSTSKRLCGVSKRDQNDNSNSAFGMLKLGCVQLYHCNYWLFLEFSVGALVKEIRDVSMFLLVFF